MANFFGTRYAGDFFGWEDAAVGAAALAVMVAIFYGSALLARVTLG